jgi:hypothetical protein
MRAPALIHAPVNNVVRVPKRRLNLVTMGPMNVIWEIERPPINA